MKSNKFQPSSFEARFFRNRRTGIVRAIARGRERYLAPEWEPVQESAAELIAERSGRLRDALTGLAEASHKEGAQAPALTPPAPVQAPEPAAGVPAPPEAVQAPEPPAEVPAPPEAVQAPEPAADETLEPAAESVEVDLLTMDEQQLDQLLVTHFGITTPMEKRELSTLMNAKGVTMEGKPVDGRKPRVELLRAFIQFLAAPKAE
jgi:hypothetical protein